MRYISHLSDLALYTNKGNLGQHPSLGKKYIFTHGQLVIGSPYTNSGEENQIVAELSSEEHLSYIFPSKPTPLEKAGLGCLHCIPDGHRALFFEAPFITVENGVMLTSARPARYKVIKGKLVFNGRIYEAGSKFDVIGPYGTETPFSTWEEGTIISPELTDDLLKKCKGDLRGAFHNAQLQTGNEPYDYWFWNREGGVIPRANPDPNADDTYFWTEE